MSGIGGYQHVPSSRDLVVCLTCGTTLGSYYELGLSGRDDPQAERVLAVARKEHEGDCRRIIAHQVKHRTSDGPCDECPAPKDPAGLPQHSTPPSVEARSP